MVRTINRATILNLIRQHQPISRVKIARLTGLNKSTISSIVNELLSENLVFEEKIKDPNVGRNPIHLRLKTNTHFVGAINLDTVYTRVAVVDIDGSVLIRDKVPTDKDNPEHSLKSAYQLLKRIQKKKKIAALEGVGISVAGMVDAGRGVVLYAPNLQWRDLNLRQIIETIDPGIKNLRIENDSKASALAELWFGQGEITKYNDFVFLSVGAGIGSGIIVGRKLLEGFNHSAGEFGHMTLVKDGLACACGNKGCLEVYASDRATARRYNEMVDRGAQDYKETMFADVLIRAMEGEPLANKALKETAVYLGIGIKNILRVIDPPAVVIGGKIIQAWSIIYPEIIKVLKEGQMFGLERKVKILPSSLKVRPRLLGAATIAIRELFVDYQIVK